MRLSSVLFALLPSVVLGQAPSAPASAPTARTSAHNVPVPSVAAVRRTGPILLDAVLDEAAWAAATPITEFTQFDPDEGKPASERMEVRFLYDDDALYVGAQDVRRRTVRAA